MDRRRGATAFLGRFALVVLLALGIRAAADGGGADAHTPDTKNADPGFPVGEELEYRLHWGVIPVGTAQVTTEWREEDTRRLIAIRARTWSNRVLATLYPVNDTIEALVEPTAFLPVRFTRNLRQGRHRYHDETTFDFETMQARYRSFVKNKELVFPIEPDTRDLVTFMYHMRGHAFETGRTDEFRVMADEKIYGLTVRVLGEERIKLPRYGKVRCLKMEPTASFNGLFVRKGRIVLWVTMDERRLLARGDLETPFANVRLLLQEVRGPGNDAWVRASGAL